MDTDQIAPVLRAPHQSDHLPVTQVMCLCYTSLGLNPPNDINKELTISSNYALPYI